MNNEVLVNIYSDDLTDAETESLFSTPPLLLSLSDRPQAGDRLSESGICGNCTSGTGDGRVHCQQKRLGFCLCRTGD